MIPTIVFTPAGRSDLMDAQDWYETQSAGLGLDFLEEVNLALARLRDNPLQFPVIFENLRRVRLRRFPYALFFKVTPENLIVIACFHASRDPQRWQQRI